MCVYVLLLDLVNDLSDKGLEGFVFGWTFLRITYFWQQGNRVWSIYAWVYWPSKMCWAYWYPGAAKSHSLWCITWVSWRSWPLAWGKLIYYLYNIRHSSIYQQYQGSGRGGINYKKCTYHLQVLISNTIRVTKEHTWKVWKQRQTLLRLMSFSWIMLDYDFITRLLLLRVGWRLYRYQVYQVIICWP